MTGILEKGRMAAFRKETAKDHECKTQDTDPRCEYPAPNWALRGPPVRPSYYCSIYFSRRNKSKRMVDENWRQTEVWSSSTV